jgi:5'-nucleotidase
MFEQNIKDSDVITEYSCSGTPVDCVKLAVNEILKKTDLCVSGSIMAPILP